MRQVRIGIKLDDELWWPALTAEARKHSLKDALASRKLDGAGAGWTAGFVSDHDGLRRTGGGAISLDALSRSLETSWVASMASSRLSL